MRVGEGSQKAAALSFAPPKDLSLLGRQIRAGRLRLEELADLTDSFWAEFGHGLVEEFGGARVDRKAQAKVRLPELVAALLDLVS